MREISFKIEEENTEEDNFDLLFNNSKKMNSRIRESMSTKLNQKNSLFKSSHFYLVAGGFMFITACFLSVQMVVNSPDIEKYRAAIKDVEKMDSEEVEISKNEPVDDAIPDIKFAYSPQTKSEQSQPVIKKQNTVISKKAEVRRVYVAKALPKPVIRQVSKPIKIAISSTRKVIPVKRIQITTTRHPVLVQKSAQSKVDQAIADIMLRPVAVVSNAGQKPAESILRGGR